ncbi:metallophosphoesterase [Chloroflexia bacterium SDU3-3]|nr:metallophosphoesterase [Chloroflexia bacterium SDU3-3]
MRLVYTADLHGVAASYQSLFDLAVARGARAAIVGGDLFPHAIRTESALDLQRAFIHDHIRPMLQALRNDHPEVAVFLLPGNDDWAAAAAALGPLESEGLVYPLHERVYDLQAMGLSDAPLWLAGYACVPLTPFSIKDYERADDGPLPPYSFGMAFMSASGKIRPATARDIVALPTIGAAMATLAQKSDPARTIYVCHTPPFDTPLDLMPRGRHTGSKALAAFIAQRQPLLTLHGHIHEAPQQSGQFAAQLGATWAANPGHDPRAFYAIALDTADVAGTIEHTVYGKLKRGA